MSDTVQSVRLCLAYLLCVPVDKIPLNLKDTSFYDLLDSVLLYLQDTSYTAVLWMPGAVTRPQGDYLVFGTRANGQPHAIVMRGKTTVYDPDPGQTGLAEERRLVSIQRRITSLTVDSVSAIGSPPGVLSAGHTDLEGNPLKDDDVIFEPFYVLKEFQHQRGTILGPPYPCYPEEATTYRERLMYQRGVADERYVANNLRDDMPALVKRLTAIHDDMPERLRKKALVGAAIAILESLQ